MWKGRCKGAVCVGDDFSVTRYTVGLSSLLHPAVWILGLVALILVVSGASAHAQANTSAITIEADQVSVYEGGLATFTLTRYGGHVDPLTVQVKTWEPDWDTPSPNPTEQTHDVRFTQGSRIATLRVAA